MRASKTVVKKLWDFLTREDVYWRLFSLVLAIILWLLAVGEALWDRWKELWT